MIPMLLLLAATVIMAFAMCCLVWGTALADGPDPADLRRSGWFGIIGIIGFAMQAVLWVAAGSQIGGAL